MGRLLPFATDVALEVDGEGGLVVVPTPARITGRVVDMEDEGLALVFVASYPVSMVTVPGQEVSNTRPPTVALLLLGVLQVGLVRLLEPPLDPLGVSGFFRSSELTSRLPWMIAFVSAS